MLCESRDTSAFVIFEDTCCLGTMRLVGGNSEFEGRVEINRGGVWGTICDGNWGIEEAQVVCREIGHGGAVAAFGSAHFGQGSGTIWLNNVDCAGNEDSLSTCPLLSDVTNTCTHADDAGVQCRDLDDCRPEPCQNGGTCLDQVNDFVCHCPHPYEGKTCDINTADPCQSGPCENGGVCSSSGGSFTCSCQPGWEGTTCQINIDECASTPCKHGGTCTDGINLYTCTCPTGWKGTDCQNFTCAGRALSKYQNPDDCKTYYECLDGFPDYVLQQCAPQYTVFSQATMKCEWPEDVEGCDITYVCSTPCENGGSCSGSDECTCPEGYGGTTCQYDLSIPFSTTLTCDGSTFNPFRLNGVCANTYYMCTPGRNIPFILSCPADLVFNNDNMVCDWRDNVPGCCTIRTGGTADFYPFGESAGDTVNPKADDGSSEKQTSAYGGGFPYFGGIYRDFWINNNGVVSFGGEVTIFTPSPFPIQSFPIVAVFWADVDNRRAGDVYWRQTTTDQSLLTQVSQDIVANHPDITSYQAGCVLVATYHDVTYYGGSANTNRQSFQVVLATDGIQSFAIFKYGDILWTTGSASMGDAATGLGGVPAQAGFNSGDGTNYHTVPGSRSSEIVDVETRTNVGQPGTFMFQINGNKIVPLGKVRLVGGSSEFNGRVEINRGGVWGTICDDDWGMEEAQVVCRELGHGGAVAAHGSAYYGQGSGPIYLNNMDCAGTEMSLSDCPLLSGGTDTCTHANDAGVECKDLDDCQPNPCANEGICLDRVDGFVCVCQPPFEGKDCNIDTSDPCFNDPCQHGGVCSADGDKFVCSCQSGWNGTTCGTYALNPCDSGPCQNGGLCFASEDKFACSCQPGWNGTTCETNIDECSPNPCQNGGVCQDLEADFSCSCPAPYEGKMCETYVNPCDSGPCQHGGVCSASGATFTCSCQPGWDGTTCGINIDDCSPDPCQNGGVCMDLVDNFFCFCPAPYRGDMCEIYVDPCDSGPCQNGGVCSASGATFTCSCQPGWNGTTCETDIDECSPNPCQNGGVCQDLEADFSCSCPAPYEGKMCEIYVDPCDSGPCQNGGRCFTFGVFFICRCQPGWDGRTCETDLDECSSNPCQNGGVCQDLVADFSCSCPAPYEGKMCEIYVDPCDSGPCQNGGVCSASGATFTCSCQPGWDGTTCETDIDECSPDPCQNGGVCQDLVADFSCNCPAPYEGKMCETYVDPCDSGPCQNGGVCSAFGAFFTCSCQPGWYGLTCEMDLDECSSDPCQNGGVCQDLLADFSCSCPAPYEGKMCETYVDPCGSGPCQNGGVCSASGATFTCSCQPGWNGTTCGMNIDECSPDPCQNGGVCQDLVADFSCSCPAPYEGKMCEIYVDPCDSGPCQNGGVCSANGATFTCSCQSGWNGATCELNIDECSPNPCQNGGVCQDLVADFSCSCPAPYEGKMCETYVNPCDSGPCQNGGVCSASGATFTCSCQPGWNGTTCETDIDECSPNPCQNGGVCQDLVADFSCSCPAPYEGKICETYVNPCGSGPCQNGGMCSASGATFTCSCQPGWNGTTCETDIDECSPDPCQNGGVCQDLVADFSCSCPASYEGKICETYVDPCSSGPCQNGGVCSASGATFTCSCQPGWNGTTCETDIDECSPNPCQNGGVCQDLVADFSCSCPAPYEGKMCEIYVDPCSSGPCQNGGVCSASGATFTCSCQPGWNGATCGMNIDECSPNPCQNGGVCQDLVADFSCSCPVPYEGKICETYVDPCSSGPCENGGVCSASGATFTCSCQPGWNGATCGMNIDECSPDPCQNGGVCQDLVADFSCSCPAPYEGKMCEIYVDPCGSAPCQHAGLCFASGDKFTCSCQPGWNGTTCEMNIDECSPDPCQNGGVCQDLVADFSCSCPAQYEGKMCEIYVDPCDSDPCQHGGVCSASGATFTCSCQPGWNGTTCGINIDDCSPDPCQNGGVCEDLVADFFCNCPSPYEGKMCEIYVDPCGSKPCQNGGVCSANGDKFTCSCQPGWDGTMCEISLDDCSPNPCQNGGVCQDLVDDFSCDCPVPYEGKMCETYVPTTPPYVPTTTVTDVPTTAAVTDVPTIATATVTDVPTTPITDGAVVPFNPDQECGEQMFFMLAGNCQSYYYVCSLGYDSPILMYCPPGLIFNKDLLVCDWPYNVLLTKCSFDVATMKLLIILLPLVTWVSCTPPLSEAKGNGDLPAVDRADLTDMQARVAMAVPYAPTGSPTADPCLSNPCLNGGTCLTQQDTYSCLCAPGWAGTNCDAVLTTPDNRGTQFMLGFLYNSGGGSQLELFITSASADPASVTITAPYASYTRQLTVTDAAVEVVTLPRSLVLTGSEKARKGILVTADKEIIVYGVNKKRATTDGFLGLPIDVMGTEYVVASYEYFQPSEFGVFGIEDGTVVDITLKESAQCNGVTYSSGRVVRVVINRFDAMQCQGRSSSDLTGTRIVSDKPISLMSGMKCVQVPNGVPACDHIVEHIPPVNTWGQRFVTVPLALRRAGDIFRIVSASDGTTVDVTGHAPRLLNSGEMWELDVPSDTYQAITSSQPVMVLQYCKSQDADGMETDPFMMYIPPIEQFAADYTFATVDAVGSSYTNYVNIVIKTSETAGLTYDGNRLPSSLTWTVIPGTDLSATQLHIATNGTHKIKHDSAIVTFSLFYYGFSSYDSVGFPGGLRLAKLSGECQMTETAYGDGVDNDCDKLVDEELLNGIDDDGDGLIDEDVAAVAHDIDECALGIAICDDNATCVNTHGSYKCVCDPGFTGDGKVCWTRSTCTVFGVTHYNTFDGLAHDFSGQCPTTLSSSCRASGNLPYFHVITNSDPRGDPTTSYVSEVTVEVYNRTIVIQQDKTVYINQIITTLPAQPLDDLTIKFGGQYVVIETTFGLKVQYDGSHRVEVTVPETYQDALCGLCGNYNGNDADEFITPDGSLAADVMQFGNSWLVDGHGEVCVANPPPPNRCDAALQQTVTGLCGMLTDGAHAFAACYSTLNPEGTYQTCVYDMCALNGDETSLCNNLQAYADACAEAGINVGSWRNTSFCPLSCPASSHYDPCSSACPATCTDVSAPLYCNTTCVEGCECDAGYVLSGDQCVLREQCGCTRDGLYYAVGQTWGEGCDRTCECVSKNNIQCTGGGCDVNATCAIQNGVQGCYCNPGYWGNGSYCGELCDINPCKNGATCINDDKGGHICVCASGWSGDACDEDLSPPDPAGPSSTAVPVIIGSYISGMMCDGWTFFLVENDCSSIYYVCSPGHDAPILFNCPANLVFNKDLGVCDWPDHVPYCSCQSGLAGASCQINLDDCSPNPCQNGGLCQDLVGDFVCHCLPSYQGKTCEIFVDPCNSGPCQHGGVCSVSGNKVTCSCQPGWNGNFCEMNIDECSPDPCQNGGVCQDLVADFSCSCPAPYEGKMCEIYVSPCGSGPCQNGGVCSASGATFTCSCQPGWNGTTCGMNIDECSPNPCQNGGVCQDLVADFSCSCPAPYEGKMCEIYVDPCGSGPCQNGGVCSASGATFTCSCQPGWNGATCGINIDECNPNPCQNGGLCQDLVADFSCSCPAPYEGKMCETYVSPCNSGPCQNGGVCSASGATFTCSCQPGWNGATCGTNLDECSPNPCQNGGVCQDLVADFSCSCPPLYEGKTCEIYVSTPPPFVPTTAPVITEGAVVPFSPGLTCNGLNFFLLDSDCSNIYYVCSPGHDAPILMHCPATLVFNKDIRVCDNPLAVVYCYFDVVTMLLLIILLSLVTWVSCAPPLAEPNSDGDSPAPDSTAFSDMRARDAILPLAYECSNWTRWINRDHPSGNGDFEDLPTIHAWYPGRVPCSVPSAVQARTVGTHIDASQTGQVFRDYRPEVGLACWNSDQSDGACLDYEVRFCCDPIPNPDPTGPSSTAVPVIIGSYISGMMCDGWTFFLVENDCSSIYYVCSPGHDAPILFHCPANLVFNKDLGVCDWPDRVPYCSCHGLAGASCQIKRRVMPGPGCCHCLPSYQGKTCEIFVDPCNSEPCQHGGVCSVSGNKVTCSCQPGWNGNFCEMNIDECSPDPCQNGGVCQDLLADFSCSCPAPYEGKMCEIYVDPCGSGPCQNGGVCSASGAAFTCSCQPGWNGATCGMNIDECSPNPCQNGGVCQDLVADFSCSCPASYEGKMCETYVSPCNSGPCQNGGVCSASGATFTCSCQPGWNGATCGTNLDECSPNPCQNGGVCQDLVADFSCSCPPLYEGKTCEIYVSTPPPYIPTTAPVITEGAVVPFSPGLTCNGLNFFLLDSDCSNIYYVCSPGHDAPILMHCPATLVFNKDIRVCDNPLAVVYCQLTTPKLFTKRSFDVTTMKFLILLSLVTWVSCTPLVSEPKSHGVLPVVDRAATPIPTTAPQGTSTAVPSTTDVPVIIGAFIAGMKCDGWTFFLVENDCSSIYYVCSPGQDAPIHMHCPANLVFNKDLGVCDWPDLVPYCSCQSGLAGASCQIDLDDCSPNPCQNGGLCQDLGGDFVCHCLPSYQGKTCEAYVDPCGTRPCQNGGVCSASGATFTCSCQPGWNGATCEMDLDECSPNPCQNGGVCQDLVADFSCSCPAPYEGKMCETYVSTPPPFVPTTAPVITEGAVVPFSPGLMCNELNFFLLENDCSSIYYVCSPGHDAPILMHCPATLVFNKDLRVCDNPLAVVYC
ncbi:uncharacterized protein LOC118409092 [Branchiostoma floridae]|uniref:Soluble scavenger receptor cysteine-rich domain-containing protein SSC5D n=2 Tax=Branchiostoma floridae TaxID=7739 RepID=A0A9J7HWX3_BRAFL|nr:uncharacterized protein LOC118409092 [Branchiostoma floridae]